MTDQMLRPPPPPLATDARTAHQDEGYCCPICAAPIGHGARVATRPDGSVAHVPCIGAWALRPPSLAPSKRSR